MAAVWLGEEAENLKPQSRGFTRFSLSMEGGGRSGLNRERREDGRGQNVSGRGRREGQAVAFLFCEGWGCRRLVFGKAKGEGPLFFSKRGGAASWFREPEKSKEDGGSSPRN